MRTDERFERPLPLITTSAESITLNTSAACEGVFHVKNSGGGLLAGRITSNTNCITFTPRDFEGNSVQITYAFTPDIYKAGDKIRTGALIMSNGGEKVIPVTINFTPPAIHTDDGARISSLTEFQAYAEHRPEQAQILLTGAAFRRFLDDIGYESVKAFERLIRDTDTERALEHFFILSGLKAKNTVFLPRKRFYIELSPTDSSPVFGQISAERTGRGYLNMPVTVKNRSKWLSVGHNIKAVDFKDGKTAAIPFVIDPKEVSGVYAADTVLVGLENPEEAVIEVKKLPPLEAWLSKEVYLPEDEGALRVINRTGASIMFEISVTEQFVKFAGARYNIGAIADIPFRVKLGALAGAQLSWANRPFVSAEIELRAYAGASRYRKRLKLTAGEW